MRRSQTVAEQRSLTDDIVRQARRVTEREVDEHRAGWVGGGGDGSGRSETDRGKTRCFEMACDQSDRLMANRSNRYEQNDIRLLGQALLDQ